MDCLAQLPKEKLFVKNYDVESGLSQAVITDLAEDNKGFIWISTFDGLNRFDGYEFTVFRYEPDDSTSLPTSKIENIFYDNGKHLWLSTANELVVFNIERGQVVRNNGLIKNKFSSVCHASTNRLWALSQNNSLSLLDKNTFEVLRNTSPNPFHKKNERIIKSIALKEKIILINENGGVHTYNQTTKSWKKRVPPMIEEDVKFHTAASDHNKTLFIGSMQTDLLEYNIQTGKFVVSTANTIQKNLIGINDLLFDSLSNTMLISTYGQGIFSYNLASQELFQYKQGDKALPLAANYPQALLKDKSQVLWIGYDGKGIDVLDPHLKKFTPTIKESPNDAFNLKFVRSVEEDEQGVLWFGTSGSGLVEYHRENNQFKFYNKGDLFPNAEAFILAIEKVNNQLWLGLNGDGILIFDIPKRKIVKHLLYGNEDHQISGGSISSLFYDKQNQQMWVGSDEKGINLIDINSLEIKKYYSANNPIYNDNGIRCFYRNKKNELLVGTTKGLIRLNTKADRFERLFPAVGVPTNNLHSIKCIYADKKGRLWLGSDGAGITILDSNYKSLRTISTKDNLNNNVIYGILAENEHSFWASSNKGVSNINWSEDDIYNQSDFLIYNYELASGLQSNEFNTNSYLKLVDGSLVFGGINGVNIFKGEEVKPSSVTPNVVITDFSVFDRQIKENKLITYINELDLAYNQNSFSLKFNTTGFTIPEKVQYRYRLIGHDKEWVEAGKRTYVSYTNLSPGNYEFQVMASNYDGLWNENYTSLQINIAYPLYLRWWFILGLLAIILFVVWSFIRNRTKERLAREGLRLEYTKEIAEVEMKALRAQINPHFLFNSLNSINNFILKNENDKARKYLVKFSQLVRNILNNSTNPYVSLKEELDTLNLYIQIESMRFDNQFHFNLNIQEDLDINHINIPSLLLQPYIENAIWHGLLHKEGNKKIEIRIKQNTKETISISIEDNGIGRKAAQKQSTGNSKGRSYGMQLGENRLKLMNSEHQSKGDVVVIDLYDDNNTGIGTLIEITLPILELKKKENPSLN